MCSPTGQEMPSPAKVTSSLWLRLIVGLVGVSLLAVVAASGALYVRFKAKNSEFREQTLRIQANLIADYLRDYPKQPLVLPPNVTQSFEVNNGRYAVVDRSGNLLAASAGVSAPLVAVDPGEGRHLFVLQPDEHQLPFYGLSLRTMYGGTPVWVQVAFHAGNIVFDSVLEEFMQDIAWIWIPFVVILLLVNLLVARIGLSPLREAARQAAAIGPAAVSMRLSENGLPRDVYALVSAVNRGLDRLETAFDAQRRFIADAAHELRTPVAVLKAHMGILSKFDGHEDHLLVAEIFKIMHLELSCGVGFVAGLAGLVGIFDGGTVMDMLATATARYRRPEVIQHMTMEADSLARLQPDLPDPHPFIL